ncbi:MAG: hypothetical protein LBK68_04960 [Candidatus Margulisbacteria bacterium]|jgi:hypothetical protein|nr:hypothetical protein [Candidatus Margulisiibacteriota bacterium]
MSWRLKLAVFLMLISVLAWPALAVSPLLPLNEKGKAVFAVSAFLFGQITWNAGLIIGGVEAVAKRKEILAWLKKIFKK